LDEDPSFEGFAGICKTVDKVELNLLAEVVLTDDIAGKVIYFGLK
jgi:hypothetical protein